MKYFHEITDSQITNRQKEREDEKQKYKIP